jgi:hypothetical protein
MGYEVHITRKAEWSDDDGPTISLAEWLAYVSSDPEMRADGYAEARTPDGVLRLDGQGIAVWTGYPGHHEDGNMAWFCHCEDRITVKNPDEAILVKMHAIASKLHAKVQGDDGEQYGPDGRLEEVDSPSGAHREKPWWRFWK